MKDLTPTMLVALGGLGFTVLSFLGARLWYGGERKGGNDARAAGTTQYMALILSEVQGGRSDTATMNAKFQAHCLEQAAQLAHLEEQRLAETSALTAVQDDQERQDLLIHNIVVQIADHRTEIAVLHGILERDGHEVTLRTELAELHRDQKERQGTTFEADEPLCLTPPPWRGEDITTPPDPETGGVHQKARRL